MIYYEDLAGLHGMIPWFKTNFEYLVDICQESLKDAWWKIPNWIKINVKLIEEKSREVLNRIKKNRKRAQ